MKRQFTLEYWIDDGWYVGKLLEVAGIFSQGETLKELEENVEDAYKMMIKKEPPMQHLKSNYRKKQYKKFFIQTQFNQRWIATVNPMI